MVSGRTLFLYFSVLVGALGILTTIIGIRQINVNVFGEAQNRVRSNCIIGRALFDGEIERIRDALRLSAQFGEPTAVLRSGKSNQALAALARVRTDSGLDFLSLTDSNGVARLRTVPPMHTGDSKVANEMIARALKGEEQRGIAILTREELEAEGEGLVERAFTVIEQTPMSEPLPSQTLESGMAMMAAVPIRAPDGRVIGVLYGGKLLNRNFELVDWLRRMAFGDEKFGDRYVGTVTLFQGSVRIATNVMRDDGTRAFGTVISSQVGNHVLNNGKTWFGRAFVVNHWFLSNYQPIRDIRNRIIGVFYMGILEKKYVAIRNKAIGALCSVTLLGMFAALIISYLLAYSLSTPLDRLARAARRISAGTLGETVHPEGHCAEVLDLTDAFNQMSKEIAEKQAILASTNAALEKANRNYLEMLGFITHEFKGPIASCVTNVYTLSHELVGPLNPKQHSILASISRSLRYFEDMVRNYLELSRIETGELVARKQSVYILRDVVCPPSMDLRYRWRGA